MLHSAVSTRVLNAAWHCTVTTGRLNSQRSGYAREITERTARGRCEARRPRVRDNSVLPPSLFPPPSSRAATSPPLCSQRPLDHHAALACTSSFRRSPVVDLDASCRGHCVIAPRLRPPSPRQQPVCVVMCSRETILLLHSGTTTSVTSI